MGNQWNRPPNEWSPQLGNPIRERRPQCSPGDRMGAMRQEVEATSLVGAQYGGYCQPDRQNSTKQKSSWPSWDIQAHRRPAPGCPSRCGPPSISIDDTKTKGSNGYAVCH